MFEYTQEEIHRWPVRAEEFMFHLMNSKGEGFTADNFYELCAKEKFPPSEIKRLAGKLFREFQAAGYINKTDKYELSRRNGSSPLPVWEAVDDISI